MLTDTQAMAYPYSRSDLLQQAPYHYMYTPFEGPALIDAYLTDRSRSAARLRDLAGKTPPATKSAISAKDIANAQAHRWESLGEVATDETLRAIVRDEALEQGKLSVRSLYLVLELGRKFEVSKRLRPRYKADLTLVTKDASAPLSTYAYVAFLLGQAAVVTGCSRFLNALLKLNDLIASADEPTLPPLAAACAAEAMTAEIAEVRRLLRSQGLGHLQNEDRRAD